MTKEEAAERLKNIIEVSKKNERNEKEIDGYDEEALEMAIDALIDIEQINEIISAPFQESALKYQMIRDIVGGKDNTITTGQHCDKCGKPDLPTWGTSRTPNHYTVYYGASTDSSTDYISRQAAIDAMYALCDTGGTLEENPWRDNPHIDAITDAIDNLPSVTPQEPKTGHWIYTDYHTWCCSECGGNPHRGTGFVPNKDGMKMRWKYCNLCGAKMVETQERSGEE